MKTFRVLGQRRVLTSLNIGAVLIFQHCIPEVKSCSMYRIVQGHSLYFWLFWRRSTHGKCMGTLSLNGYALENTTTDCTPMYHHVQFGSLQQVAIHPQVTESTTLYIVIHRIQNLGRFLARMLSPWFTDAVYCSSQLLGNTFAQIIPLLFCYVTLIKIILIDCE